ncbi:unnamed protein product [Euphydryas editha]|uniref:Reverse transcriptase domain-containing protein n=1 Tax=Euphydryas editha TaxID=104508 RepID=A0AAU9TCU7_EUPED|nr:unnamed protein product [Euphydryas editha]
MYLGDNVATSGEEISKQFAAHFSSNFIPSICPNSSRTSSRSYSQFGLGKITFTEGKLLKLLRNLDACKGPGPDGLPALFVKRCSPGLSSPLKIIFNQSIASSKFPSEWKIANVVPIFKKGESNISSNYRPISLLSIFAKLFEAAVCPVITSHIKPQLAPQQHGFCVGRSTTTNLLSYVNDISKSLDNRIQVDSIYTDFSSAFDKVNHKLLIKKLEQFGIFGSLLNWFASYLSERKQRVVLRGYESPPYLSSSGVPQGSHLGPILFVVFVNDIVNSIKHCKCSLYADDLKIYRDIKTNSDVLLLQQDLDAIQNWCHDNLMILNTSKCYHMTFTRNRNILASKYSLNGVSLQKVDTIRDLGVQLDRKLSFVNHFDTIVAKALKIGRFCKESLF